MRFVLLTLLFITSLLVVSQSSDRDSLLSVWQDEQYDLDECITALLGVAQTYYGRDYDSLQMLSQQALELAQEHKLVGSITASHNLLGNANFRQANYEKALVHYASAMNGAKLLNDSLRIAAQTNNMGTVNIYMRNFEEAIRILKETELLRRKLDDPKISSTVNNLGIAYQRMRDFDRALVHFKEAATLKEAAGQYRSAANTLQQHRHHSQKSRKV
ncbi:MAG: tetratricopeptide repeat protein [Cyclobacteriaceae bacterium]